jgi:hypothetical protein
MVSRKRRLTAPAMVILPPGAGSLCRSRPPGANRAAALREALAAQIANSMEVRVDPTRFFPGYAVEIDDDAQTLGLGSPGEAAVLSIVTIPGDVRETSADLFGPIVMNAASRKAKQAILQNEAYTTKHRLLDSPALTQAPATVQASG